MFYPTNIEEKIDFTVIREELRRRCTSCLGRERVEAMQMETEYAKVKAMLTLTDQMRMAHEDAKVSMPRGEIYDLRESIARIVWASPWRLRPASTRWTRRATGR